jgi:chromosome segregation ATPase
MQLVVAQVAAAGVVVIEASTRASLEVPRVSAEDRAIAAETAAATAATERDSLVSKLALVEAEVERLRAAAASVEEAAERAKSAAATVNETARDAAEAAAHEKAALETKMLELEINLRTATTDLTTTSRQFSQVTNQLQVAIEEVSRLQDSNTKLSQDLDATLGDPPALD